MTNRMFGTIEVSNKFILQVITLLLFASFLFLNGCSTVTTKDGPPSYPVDETKIPNAVPKKESLAKYGNYSTYRVFGRAYHTMKSSKNYVAEGTASWYGTKFHAMKTSSGERYNMLAMTAAHKTLPLPTYVRVTNLGNSKQVIVKVNDRGPFEGNRLIDLSFVAAKKLGMVGHGTAHVRVEAIDPDQFNHHGIVEKFVAHNKTNHTYGLAANGSNVYLQVGAFKNRRYAERLQTRLSKVMDSPVRITQLNNRRLYHVQIGPIKDKMTAHQISKHLHSIGLSYNTTTKPQMEV